MKDILFIDAGEALFKLLAKEGTTTREYIHIPSQTFTMGEHSINVFWETDLPPMGVRIIGAELDYPVLCDFLELD